MATKLNLFLQKKNKRKKSWREATTATTTRTADLGCQTAWQFCFLLDFYSSLRACVCVCECAKFMLLFASQWLRCPLCAAPYHGFLLLFSLLLLFLFLVGCWHVT